MMKFYIFDEVKVNFVYDWGDFMIDDGVSPDDWGEIAVDDVFRVVLDEGIVEVLACFLFGYLFCVVLDWPGQEIMDESY